MDMNFCRRCGSALENVENHVYRCANGHTIFANASPTVGVFLIAPDGDVLLSRRGIEPNKGALDSFGGFCDGIESLEQAAVRELQEELSLQPGEYGELHYIKSYGATYRYAAEDLSIASCVFWAKLLTDRSLTPSDDVAEIVKIPIIDIDESSMHSSDTTRAVLDLKDMKARGEL